MSVRSLMADPDFKRLSPERQRVMLRKVGATPGFVQDFQRQQIGNMGEENANRLAGPQARKDQTPIDISQVMGPGGRGGISRAAGGPSPEVGLAANVAGLALPGMVMNPIATGLAAGRGYVAEEASSRMGASKTASTTLGVLASIGPRAVLSGLSRLVGMGAKKGAKKLVTSIFPKTEAEFHRASATLREAGHTQAEINALIAPVAKMEQKAATTAVKAAVPKPAPVTPSKAPTKAAPVVPPKAPTAAQAVEGNVINMEPTRTLAQAEAKHVSASATQSAGQPFLRFVKEEGPKFKPGERVWFVKDAAGNPVKTFESGAAATGWTKRTVNKELGYTTDFFENLWAK